MPDKPAAVTAVESPRTRLDGYVKRSDGKSTVWLNGEPVPVGTASAGRADTFVAQPAGQGDGRRGEGKKRRIPLRVGETLERDSGEVKDMSAAVRSKFRRRRGNR